MNFKTLHQRAVDSPKQPIIAVAQAEGTDIFEALQTATHQKLCSLLLIGDKTTIAASLEQTPLSSYEIIETDSPAEAATAAVAAIREGRADLLMKGNLSTDILLKAVLQKEVGLPHGNLLSHIAVYEREDNFLIMTDGGMCIAPDLSQKISIIENAVGFAHRIGNPEPIVAVLSAVEKVNPKISASIDAALLSTMARHHQITGARVYGPVALDIALSAHARKIKGFDTILERDADILVVPDITTGNVLGKSLMYCAHYPSGGLVLGTSCPIILLSRADSPEEKFHSILLGLTSL